MMHTNKVFSVVRAWYALRGDLQQQSRAILVGAGATAALILVANVTTANNAFEASFHAAFFPLALFVVGFLLSSTQFADLHDKPRAHAYLTLPISTLERWTVRLLVSTVGYAVLALVGYFLVTLLGAGVSQLIWGWSHAIFVPDAHAWRTVLSYLVTSSLFLFGGVYFRRWHAFKVILAVAAMLLALALLAPDLAWLLFFRIRRQHPRDSQGGTRILALRGGGRIGRQGLLLGDHGAAVLVLDLPSPEPSRSVTVEFTQPRAIYLQIGDYICANILRRDGRAGTAFRRSASWRST